MAVAVFTLQLNYDILPGLVTIGKYDGSHYCITAATVGDKVIIHRPYRRDNEISLLNVEQKITSLCAGKLSQDEDKEVLVIGSPDSVLVYHVDNNSDVFYQKVSDGANVLQIGQVGSGEQMVIVGGNCVLQGFNATGEDAFWTVTGDQVRSLCLADLNDDGCNELIVGSDDYELRVFKEDVLTHEITETAAVTALVSIRGSQYAYALSNGTIGVYNKTQRVWRVKSKNLARCLASFDIDGDGVEELIVGWSNGKIDGRNSLSGEVIFRDALSHGIAGIVCGDYRLAGTNQLIVISEKGEVRGYDSSSLKQDTSLQPDVVKELLTRKQVLTSELKNYLPAPGQRGIPANTRLVTEMFAVESSQFYKFGHVNLSLSTNNQTLLRAVTIFSEGIFDGETLVVHPKLAQVSNSLKVALISPKNIPYDIHIRAFVGNTADSDQLHVFELTRQLPRFSTFLLLKDVPDIKPKNFVTFTLNTRPKRLDLWLNQNFLLAEVMESNERAQLSEWSATFRCLRDGSILRLHHESNTMTIATEDISLAADVLQSLAFHFNLERVDPIAEFPTIHEELKRSMENLDELRKNISRMATSTADNVSMIKSLIVQAEDARILKLMKNMRDCYVQLYQLNKEMTANSKIVCENHSNLMNILKNINSIIQHATRLHVGKNKSEIISLSRNATANNNVDALIKIIQTGRL
nr:PREDICTED: Bardet-Biedl syndrome 2 protein homolog [Bemisia tabaci]